MLLLGPLPLLALVDDLDAEAVGVEEEELPVARDFAVLPRHHSAFTDGHVPTLRDGLLRFLGDLDEHRGYGVTYGIGRSSLPRFALASYNAGPAQALAGYRVGNLDRFTASGDYSADTMRRAAHFHRWLRRRGIR